MGVLTMALDVCLALTDERAVVLARSAFRLDRLLEMDPQHFAPEALPKETDVLVFGQELPRDTAARLSSLRRSDPPLALVGILPDDARQLELAYHLGRWGVHALLVLNRDTGAAQLRTPPSGLTSHVRWQPLPRCCRRASAARRGRH